MSLRFPRIAFLAISIALGAHAEVRLPKILGSHMVLQRDQPMHMWGWSEPGERVSVTLTAFSWQGSPVSAVGDRLGRWSVYLPPQPSGGPFQIKIAATNTVTLDDVLIGDVWFASGQSNMEMPLNGFTGAPVRNGPEEISHADHPNIRLLFVRHKASAYPLKDFDVVRPWTACNPHTAADFSAVAYFFGREISTKENIPIGLIDSTWGGTPAEAWMSMDGLTSDSSLMPVFAEHAEMANQQADAAAMLAAEKSEDAAAKSAGQPPPRHSWHPDYSSWNPAWLYNGMVAPAIDFPIKGVVWYQGESNSSHLRASMYEKVFPALISNWRKRWNIGEFPFLYVQISSFKSTPSEMWGIVREAQRRTLSLANTAMAVTMDVGDPENVHPADKQTVGARLALGARALVYHESVEYTGPVFRQASVDGEGIRAWFTHAKNGLVVKGGTLEGFEIAGEDHQFVEATARVDGASVLAASPQVTAPKYIRFGWRNSPDPIINLYNSADLPASPFTSEEKIPTP